MRPTSGRWPVAGGRWLIGLLLLIVAGCGAANEAGAPIGDVAHGRRLYRGEEKLALNANEACIDCHNDTVGGESVIGQNLSNIGVRAANVVPGQPAIDYLRASILKPDEHLSGNFQEGIMPRTYPETLTDQDVDDLIAYMLTLKSGVDE
jgi:mono/diheme cytochrome c family protein